MSKRTEDHASNCAGVLNTTVPNVVWCPVCGLFKHAGMVEPELPEMVHGILNTWDTHVAPVLVSGTPCPSWRKRWEDLAARVDEDLAAQRVVMRHYAELYAEADQLRRQNAALVESNNQHVDARRKAEAEAVRLDKRLAALEGAMNPQDVLDAYAMTDMEAKAEAEGL
jgi:hypothetical protein